MRLGRTSYSPTRQCRPRIAQPVTSAADMTTVTGQTSAAAAHYAQSTAGKTAPKAHDEVAQVTNRAEKPSWRRLFGCVSTAYMFVDPYLKRASWIEWLLTNLAFAIFLALCTMASIYWSRKRVMQRVCFAMAALAGVFAAYRPERHLLLYFCRRLRPLAVGGSLRGSATIIWLRSAADLRRMVAAMAAEHLPVCRGIQASWSAAPSPSSHASRSPCDRRSRQRSGNELHAICMTSWAIRCP